MNNIGEQVDAVFAKSAEAVGQDLIDAATNIFGALSPQVRARLLALIIEPSPETWDNACTIILNDKIGMGRTLWQAMLQVDPDCPERGAPEGLGERIDPATRWAGYAPTAFDVLTAIAHAVNEQPRER